jgi:phospholipid/cholesterol/gamma-HCH transport system substrate-binding protein
MAPLPPDSRTPAEARADRPERPERPERLELRAGVLLLLLLTLVIASGIYLLYARGTFEKTQRLVLIADDSEGVVVGMDLTFSGFPIGRVSRIELAPDASVRILVDVPRKDAHWLRQSSVFTMSRGLVGNVGLRAYSGLLTDALLPDGAERRVLSGDATSDIPKVVSAIKELLANLNVLTAADGALAVTLANAQAISGRFGEPSGALGVLMGSPKDAQRVVETLNRTNQLLASVDGLVKRTDGVVGRADAQIFGPQGLTSETQATVQQMRALLGDARSSLQRVDGLLQEAQATARNVRVATDELEPLRGEIEASLRKVDGLVNEINRKWPFKRDAEVKLP